ncbi:Hypothetical predicted protein [Mytilus galloprovincialis]|uniref:Uncharacterized protein n=1 Tax=Mytilus galloprovincialis TaxID=29158 RepID=A0A8B6D3Q1_MYTGA|nr:Hypothetical predicted protein [Mytilus galloprovincialis]
MQYRVIIVKGDSIDFVTLVSITLAAYNNARHGNVLQFICRPCEQHNWPAEEPAEPEVEPVREQAPEAKVVEESTSSAELSTDGAVSVFSTVLTNALEKQKVNLNNLFESHFVQPVFRLQIFIQGEEYRIQVLAEEKEKLRKRNENAVTEHPVNAFTEINKDIASINSRKVRQQQSA